jgi:hypothetical protein
MFFMHSKIVLGGLPVSFEKSEIRSVFQDGMYSNISMVLICNRSTLIKSHISEVCAIALKAVSIIQSSLIPFSLSKLLNLINTERVCQNIEILDSS